MGMGAADRGGPVELVEILPIPSRTQSPPSLCQPPRIPLHPMANVFGVVRRVACMQVYKLPSDRLYATYFGGDKALGLPADDEARDIW